MKRTLIGLAGAMAMVLCLWEQASAQDSRTPADRDRWTRADEDMSHPVDEQICLEREIWICPQASVPQASIRRGADCDR